MPACSAAACSVTAPAVPSDTSVHRLPRGREQERPRPDLHPCAARCSQLTAVGGTGISFLTTRTIINSSLGEHYAQLRAAQAAQTGNLLGDGAVGDAHQPLEEKVDPRAQLARDLSNIGGPRERTRWTKGRGLEGEVEEEAELRDTYHRPGVPRNV
jgi:hypothetical protein